MREAPLQSKLLAILAAQVNHCASEQNIRGRNAASDLATMLEVGESSEVVESPEKQTERGSDH